jgi:hypothetical protein
MVLTWAPSIQDNEIQHEIRYDNKITHFVSVFFFFQQQKTLQLLTILRNIKSLLKCCYSTEKGVVLELSSMWKKNAIAIATFKN